MIDEKELNRLIGESIKHNRTHYRGQSMTQEQLATKVGVKRTSITNIERGAQSVPIGLLYKLCNVFDIDLSKLLPNIEKVKNDIAIPIEKDLQTNIGVASLSKEKFDSLDELANQYFNEP